MLRNYFKIALRVFEKHKLYTAINIGGLTIGLAAAFLIFLWLQDEEGIEEGVYADPSILSMFSFDILKGSLGNALDRPDKIVLTKSLADKYFIDRDPIGESFTFNNGFVSFDFEVSAIIAMH